jgi:hypothetical protein
LALAFVAVAQAAPGAPGAYAADYYVSSSGISIILILLLFIFDKLTYESNSIHFIKAYPKYQYSYGVKDALTGDQKSAHESRDGDVVKGSYSLVQPDGVLRTVRKPIYSFF